MPPSSRNNRPSAIQRYKVELTLKQHGENLIELHEY
jgi:hypothetical protein